jgi:hypothetical protein
LKVQQKLKLELKLKRKRFFILKGRINGSQQRSAHVEPQGGIHQVSLHWLDASSTLYADSLTRVRRAIIEDALAKLTISYEKKRRRTER